MCVRWQLENIHKDWVCLVLKLILWTHFWIVHFYLFLYRTHAFWTVLNREKCLGFIQTIMWSSIDLLSVTWLLFGREPQHGVLPLGFLTRPNTYLDARLLCYASVQWVEVWIKCCRFEIKIIVSFVALWSISHSLCVTETDHSTRISCLQNSNDTMTVFNDFQHWEKNLELRT